MEGALQRELEFMHQYQVLEVKFHLICIGGGSVGREIAKQTQIIFRNICVTLF